MDTESEINTAADSMNSLNKESDKINQNNVGVKNDKPIIKTIHCGLDVGTMNLIASKMVNGDITTKGLRNVFLKTDKGDVDSLDLSRMSHVKFDDSVYFLSEDAYIIANMFNLPVSRPMYKGMISSSEIDSIDILTVLVKELIGEGTPGSICYYSIPANPIDSETDVLYHERVFGRIITQLGYIAKPINEAVAVVYSECGDSDFSGIGISFGAGMTNVALVFRSIPILSFSLTRGGDWIDQMASSAIGMVPNRITQIKESKNFTLTDYKTGPKKNWRIQEPIIHYYNSLISYTTDSIIRQLNTIESEFPSELPMVLSGGTSKADGFTDAVVKILNNYDFPFTISEVRTAKDQLNAVADGCLIRSMKM